MAPHTNLWVRLNLNFGNWTGFAGLIGSIAFSVSRRNREMAIPFSIHPPEQAHADKVGKKDDRIQGSDSNCFGLVGFKA